MADKKKKGKPEKGKPIKELTPAQKAAKTKAEKRQKEQALARVEAQRLAQIVNLYIAGYSFDAIGAATGHTAAEIDRMLAKDTARFVKNQPALRNFVKSWISERYTTLLDTSWPIATDERHPKMLEAQDRALKVLDRMAKLHGAEAPSQTEVKVETAPEAVEALVQRIAAQQGYGYDMTVFDETAVFDTVAEVVDGEVVHEAAQQNAKRLAIESAPEDTEVEGEGL